MNAKDVLRDGFNRARMVTGMVLGDLQNADLLVRPCEGANHIAWQLGHLISAERHFGEAIRPGSMPPLPDGFAEKHSKETAASNDATAFLPKEEYINLYSQQREALVDLLDKLPDSDLDKPTPEGLNRIAPTLGDLFHLAADHELMHVGQFTAVRRKLGKPVAF